MERLYTSTPKEYISNLPLYKYDGPIIVVDTPEACSDALEELSHAKIVGIDTETRPSFKKGCTNSVALLQVANGEKCFLFRLNKLGFRHPIAKLLSNPDIKKVGLSLHDDINGLQQLSKFKPAGLIELQAMAKEFGVEDQSLRKLFANFFKLRISKSSQLSNWEASELSPQQLLYAATDAHTCLMLLQKMEELRESRDYEIIPLSEPTTA